MLFFNFLSLPLSTLSFSFFFLSFAFKPRKSTKLCVSTSSISVQVTVGSRQEEMKQCDERREKFSSQTIIIQLKKHCKHKEEDGLFLKEEGGTIFRTSSISILLAVTFEKNVIYSMYQKLHVKGTRDNCRMKISCSGR